jgi:ABC-type glycerol-3-phosphate transport system permease component
MSGNDEQIGPGIPSFPLTRGLMFVLLGFSLFPIVWIMLTSIKTELNIFSIPPQVFVRPDFTSYAKFLGLGTRSALPFIWNSLFIAVVTTVLTLLISSLAAYAFSRYRFRWSGHLLVLMLATRLLPPVTAVVPLYLVFRYLGILDTKLILIMVYTALNIPFATWLMKAFFDGIPKDLEEAAALDGCGALRTLARVTFPLASSGIAATSIFVFLLAWNEFMFAFMLTSVNVRTMPVRLAETIGEMQVFWQDMATLATLIMLPALLVGFFMQRYLIRALTAGAVK